MIYISLNMWISSNNVTVQVNIDFGLYPKYVTWSILDMCKNYAFYVSAFYATI